MKNLYEDYKADIKDYCEQNSLDFEKLSRMPKSRNSEFVAFQCSNPNVDKHKLTIGGPPMPVVLWLRKKGNAVEFEQTEHTAKYLRA